MGGRPKGHWLHGCWPTSTSTTSLTVGRQWRKRYAHGEVIIVRFADDFVAGFEDIGDAQRFLTDLRERFTRFGLELHPDKTRLIEFGRFAAQNRKARSVGKPETFDFLGFTHICGTRTRDGRFWLKTQDHHEADAGQACSQRPTQATAARADTGAGAMAGKRGERAPRLLRRARQHRGRQGLP